MLSESSSKLCFELNHADVKLFLLFVELVQPALHPETCFRGDMEERNVDLK
jgi:hypothetical protein